MIDFFSSLGKRKLIALTMFTILLIALPLVLFQVRKQQNLKQRAEGLNTVSLELYPANSTVVGKGYEFHKDIYLRNSGNKNISAVDVTITYDSDALDLISFYSTNKIFTTIVKDTDTPGKIHFVGVNTGQSPIIDSRFSLGTFTLRPRVQMGSGTINFSNITITSVGETEPLEINTADNIPGTYTVGEPTPIPSMASAYSTPVNLAASPTVLPIPSSNKCDAPIIISCSVNINGQGNISWTSISGTTQYRLDWCYNDADFTEDVLANDMCGTIFTTAPNAYIIPPGGPKASGYRVRVKAQASNSCSTMNWSVVESCVYSISTPYPTQTPPIPSLTPTPQPPFISDIGIDPQSGPLGTKFTVFANVKSEDKIQEVKANIKFEKAFSFITSDQDSLTLFDDGLHGDSQPNDGFYANVWDSNGKGLIKTISIEAKGLGESLATLNKAFEINQDLCKEAVSGHNDKNARRVNIVFIGANYGNSAPFVKDVNLAIDFDGILGGLFSQEPFRSNKNKFNFWYSSQIGSIKNCDVEKMPGNIVDFAQCRSTINVSASSCVISNKRIVGLINVPFRSFAFGKTAYVFTASYLLQVDKAKVVAHEFGHSFGKLTDEYIGSNVFNPGGVLERIFGEEKSDEAHNIFTGSREACLSPKNAWYNLIGRGCGVDSKVDCIESYNPDKDELICIAGVDRESCHKEVTCFKGAVIPDYFRSSFQTIMRNSLSVDTKNFSRGYGPVNERELCKKIKEQTGSVGGICNEYGL